MPVGVKAGARYLPGPDAIGPATLVAMKTREVVALGVLIVLGALLALLLTLAPTYTIDTNSRPFGGFVVGERR